MVLVVVVVAVGLALVRQAEGPRGTWGRARVERGVEAMQMGIDCLVGVDHLFLVMRENMREVGRLATMG